MNFEKQDVRTADNARARLLGRRGDRRILRVREQRGHKLVREDVVGVEKGAGLLVALNVTTVPQHTTHLVQTIFTKYTFYDGTILRSRFKKSKT